MQDSATFLDIATFLMVMTAGFTVSGIAANLYRITGFDPDRSSSGQLLRVVVLVFSGPSEMFEAAVLGRITRQWSALSFWLVITMIMYWSLVLGLLAFAIAKAL